MEDTTTSTSTTRLFLWPIRSFSVFDNMKCVRRLLWEKTHWRGDLWSRSVVASGDDDGVLHSWLVSFCMCMRTKMEGRCWTPNLFNAQNWKKKTNYCYGTDQKRLTFLIILLKFGAGSAGSSWIYVQSKMRWMEEDLDEKNFLIVFQKMKMKERIKVSVLWWYF